jgi:hypothetical protein
MSCDKPTNVEMIVDQMRIGRKGVFARNLPVRV